MPTRGEFLASISGKSAMPRYMTATGVIAPGTAAKRDLHQYYSEVIDVIGEKCIGCMQCIFVCPDTAFLASVLPKDVVERGLAKLTDKRLVAFIRKHIAAPAATKRYAKLLGDVEHHFLLMLDYEHCKACGVCVTVCPTKALLVEPKALITLREGEDANELYKGMWEFALSLPRTRPELITGILDTMLDQDALFSFTGGVGSCWGCGETPVIRIALAESVRLRGPDSVAIVAATGCNTVYGSTYPWNPFNTSWMNSLFENACEDAMGLRMGFDQQGLADKVIWAIGGDGAMYDIGFGGLSRLLTSNQNVKVLVLDSQAYSNTGGQASGATPYGASAKMAPAGKVLPGKTEWRKELGLIAVAHQRAYVAQVSLSNIPHMQRAIRSAIEFNGPAVIIAYTPCVAEHGIAKDVTVDISKLAVESREFPLFVYDPSKGELFSQRLNLQGNPSVDKDWHTRPDGKEITIEDFAKAQGRYKHIFARPDSKEIVESLKAERMRLWRQLQEMAGMRKPAQ